MKKLSLLMNGNAAGKLTGMAIGTIATMKSRRANGLVGVIAIAGAAYVGKKIIERAKEDYHNGEVNEDFLGGLIIGLVGSAVGGTIITGLVGEPTQYPLYRNVP